MNQQYWDGLAAQFEDKVMEIAKVDRKGILRRIARQEGGPRKVALDFGCGTGSSTRLLSPYFARVIGLDFSAKLIDRALSQKHSENTEFRRRDLTRLTRITPKGDMSFLVNVLINPVPGKREAILRNVIRNTRQTGLVVVVVPALESVLHVYRVLQEADVSSGVSRSRAISSVSQLIKQEVVSLADGIVSVGEQPTKHFTNAELRVLAQTNRLTVVTIQKICYSWLEETDNPQTLEAFENPWDWVMVARRR